GLAEDHDLGGDRRDLGVVELARDLDGDLPQHDRHRDHEDDEQHQDHVDQRGDVDAAARALAAASYVHPHGYFFSCPPSTSLVPRSMPWAPRSWSAMMTG